MPKFLLPVFAVFLLLVGAVFGFMVGGNKTQPRWYQAPATVSVAEHHAVFDADGPTYEVHASVPWFDGSGTLHESGWPECLTDHTTSARFLSTPRVVEDIDVRPVLAVDCRD